MKRLFFITILLGLSVNMYSYSVKCFDLGYYHNIDFESESSEWALDMCNILSALFGKVNCKYIAEGKSTNFKFTEIASNELYKNKLMHIGNVYCTLIATSNNTVYIIYKWENPTPLNKDGNMFQVYYDAYKVDIVH